MIIGAPPAVRARALNRRALFPAPCGRRGACAKTPASDFVTRRESFAQRGAKCAPQSVGLGESGGEWRRRKRGDAGYDRARSREGRKRVKTFGELIARRRKELGLTQSELGARIKGRSGEPVSQKRITDMRTI